MIRIVPLWCAIAAVLLLGSCHRKPVANVLLVTIDTLRPDSLGFIGGNNDTPVLDGLAQTGRAFRRAVSPVPLTLPAHASILSGRLPRSHGIRDNGQTVPADLPLLQETLRRNGYVTSAFVSGFPLQKIFGLDRGFDHYDDVMKDGEQGWVERRAEDTVAAATAWLASLDADKPWFNWVHFYDPHDPYQPPRQFWQPGPRGAYDGEVAYTDYWLGKLIDAARKAGGDRPLLIVVSADHGEALGEHQEKTHGFFVYDSTLRVPLLFEWPGRISHATSDAAVQTVDITPTVLELLGIANDTRMDGISLAKGLTGGDVPTHPALSETWLPWTYYGWAPLTSWQDGDWKFIDAPRPELYALDRDANEQSNLVATETAMADRLALALDAASKAKPNRIASGQADDKAMERLRSLGYVGVGAAITDPPPNLPDPKDRIAVRDALQHAEDLLRLRRYGEAQVLFEQVLRDDPDNRFATLRSGITLLYLGRSGDAVRQLQHAVAIDPRRAEARFALGDALMREQDYLAASEQWAALAELQPRRAEAWFNLAESLKQAGQHERAEAALLEYRQLSATIDSTDTPKP